MSKIYARSSYDQRSRKSMQNLNKISDVEHACKDRKDQRSRRYIQNFGMISDLEDPCKILIRSVMYATN